MCVIGIKVGQGHRNDYVCNNSVDLPNVNIVRKLLCVPEEIGPNRKLGQATLTDFHEVKVTFVGADANNTSTCTSLLGGFMVVITAFEICIIFDLSHNCVSQSQK